MYNLRLRLGDSHPTHHVHELDDAYKERFGVFVGVHFNVLQLLGREGFLCPRRRQRPFRDDSPGLMDRVTGG